MTSIMRPSKIHAGRLKFRNLAEIKSPAVDSKAFTIQVTNFKSLELLQKLSTLL
jgi:hypothetical protein